MRDFTLAGVPVPIAHLIVPSTLMIIDSAHCKITLHRREEMLGREQATLQSYRDSLKNRTPSIFCIVW